MKLQVLIIFTSVLVAHYASSRVSIPGEDEKHRPKNPDELKAAIKAPWASVTPQQLHTLIASMPRRTDAGTHDFAGLGEPDRRGMDERSTSEDDRICFLLQEKDWESHISCKHRLTRSKFNYNPFGLRFGKRDGRLKPDRSGTRKMLPALLLVRELEEAS